MEEILKGKRILIVDDEPDILETLKELPDMCIVETAPDFENVWKFLKRNFYDPLPFWTLWASKAMTFLNSAVRKASLPGLES